jgi:hypothetical protein
MSGERGGQGIGPSLPIHLPGNVLSRNAPFHKQLTEKRKDGRLCHMLAAKENFQSFSMICRKPHVASSICLRATIFQTPKGLCGHTVQLIGYKEFCMSKAHVRRRLSLEISPMARYEAFLKCLSLKAQKNTCYLSRIF